jgi:hypothetical protein
MTARRAGVVVLLLALPACGGGIVGDSTAPTVSSTSPANSATNVAPDTAVDATFSEAMNVATLTTASFTLTGPSGAVAGSVGYSGLTARFSPSGALDTNTPYTATVTTAARDPAGNSLAGNHAWSFTTRPFTRQFGTTADDYGYGVATDAGGNVYVAGFTEGTLDGQTSAGGSDLFVVKYDASGVRQWTRQLGTAAEDVGLSVATDAGGNVYVAGYTAGALDGQTSAGGSDLFVVKYDASGVRQWTRQLGTAAEDYGSGVATDASGNVYVTGSTEGALDGQTSAGGYDLFVVKYDASGVRQWTRQLGTAAWDAGYDVATDAGGNVYVAGYTEGALDGQTSAGGLDLIVVKYDSSGVRQWTRQLGTATEDVGVSVATDAGGNVYVGGYTTGALDGQTWAGSNDIVVVKYDASGVRQWTRQLGTTTGETGRHVATDAGGNVYVTGRTVAALDGQTWAGGGDSFVVKYDASGVRQWTRQFGTAADDYGNGVAIDAGGNVYVAGFTLGALDGQPSAGGLDVFVVKYDGSGNKK